MILNRLAFASRYAAAHLLVSVVIAILSATVVFELWYPMPYRKILAVGNIYLMVLVVDVMCGPLLTLVLVAPQKSLRERWVDLSLVSIIQVIALAFGMHSVWLARPVVLAFVSDRLVVVTANEIQTDALPKAPEGLGKLPWAGVLHLSTRKAVNSDESFQSIFLELGGLSPAMQPDWWQSWGQARDVIRNQAKPLTELIARRPQAARALREAASSSGIDPAKLFYLPLTSSKVKEWVALLDGDMKLVGYAPVDGF